MPADLKRVFQTDFEKGMLALVQKYGGAVNPLMAMLTEYFASFRLDGSGRDSYSQLLAGPRRNFDHVVFSTLNYECLFEIAAHAHRLNNVHGPAQDRLGAGHVRIWKLHGSCTYIAPGLMVAGGGGITIMPGVQFSTDRLQVAEPVEAIHYARTTGLYGAMCLYTVNKPIHIGADVIGEMQQSWGDAVRSAKKVIVIGTRPHDEDRHLWEPLAMTAAHLHFVGNKTEFDSWVRRTRRKRSKSHYMGDRFEKVVPDVRALLKP